MPQLIRGRFNERRFGPPQGFTPASSWSWQDRRVSGVDMQTRSPCSDSLSLRLRLFALASLACTNSQAHSSIGTTSGLNALCLLVSTRFQVLFHSPPGVLFTFPSRYLFAIGSRTVFSLAGRSPRLRTGSLVSRLTLDTASIPCAFGYGALTPYGPEFHPVLLPARGSCRSPEPQLALVWASPLSLATTNGIDLSFFSSRYFDVSVPWVAPHRLLIHRCVACM